MKDLDCPFCGREPAESCDGLVVCQTLSCALYNIPITREKWRVRASACARRWTKEINDVVSYLNEATGSSYRPGTGATQRHVRARLNEGFTVDDAKAVIDYKVAQWGRDEEMCQFLRPQTLFGNKFEAYLQAAKREEMVDQHEAESARRRYSQREEERSWQHR
jgi:uncharacterized phage protein (TIGR02220 family)